MAKSFGAIPQTPQLQGRIRIRISETLESVAEREQRGVGGARIFKSTYVDVILGESKRTFQARAREAALAVLMPEGEKRYELDRLFPGESEEDIAERFRARSAPSL